MLNTKNTLRIFFASLVGFMFLGLSACHDDPEYASIQVINASHDAPLLSVRANSNLIVQTLSFGAASPAQSLTIKSDSDADATNLVSVNIQSILPDGSTPSVIERDLTLANNTNTLVVATNTYADIEPIIITRDGASVPSDKTRLRVIHAAVNAPQIDIYATGLDSELASSSSIATAAFRDNSGELELGSGEYRIRITEAGSQTVLFDTGSVNAVSLTGGDNMAIIAIENTLAGSTPIQLLVVNDNSGTFFIDTNTPSELRVINTSPDSPALDVYIDDALTTPLFENLAYADSSDFVEVIPETYNLAVVETATTTPELINEELALTAGANFSVYALNTLANIKPLVVSRVRRRVSTEAKLDIVHASLAAGDIDIYFTEPGTDITTTTPIFTGVSFEASSNFLGFSAGVYDLTITPTGTTTASIGPTTITLVAGGIYTAIAADSVRTATDNDGLPLELILIDDFITP